jgi:excisionase family DNA binding protein
MTTKPNLVTPEEAANYLSVSHRTLAKWRSIGFPNIPFFRIGKCIRYSKADLDIYLEKHVYNKVGG